MLLFYIQYIIWYVHVFLESRNLYSIDLSTYPLIHPLLISLLLLEYNYIIIEFAQTWEISPCTQLCIIRQYYMHI